MRQIIDRIFRIIAPNPCLACGLDDALLCKNCILLMPESESVCFKCYRPTEDFDTCFDCLTTDTPIKVICGTDYEFMGKSLVYELKFNHSLEAADIIAKHLALITEGLSGDTVIVPLPTSAGRVRARGFDQSVLIAKNLSKLLQLKYANALNRTASARQTSLSRQARISNKGELFGVDNKRLEGVESVLLIDDVISTGSTVESATRLFRELGIKNVCAVVFAANRKL